jgi:hypothetical protein
MKDCMTAPDDAGNDCVLFSANHHATQGKKDGNVWIVSQWQKCHLFDVSPAAWPDGENTKKAAENLLDSIFANCNHKTVLLALGLLMKAGSKKLISRARQRLMMMSRVEPRWVQG